MFGFGKKSKPIEKTTTQDTGILSECGVSGAKISNGYVYEEFLPQLSQQQGRKIYREMRDNDPTIGAIKYAIDMTIRSVAWSVEENTETAGTQEAEDAAKFIEGCLFDDMSITFDDFIAEVNSQIEFGWQLSEVVYKRRLGPDQQDGSMKSIYNDGAIGIRKLAGRAQETVDRWEMGENGEVLGMWQMPPYGGELKYIPLEKALLFRAGPQKGSPEGRSILRNAYRPWYFKKHMEEVEAIASERELNGLPVVKIPDAILNGTDEVSLRAKAAYVKMGRDVKFNEQGSVIIPSNPYYDADGKPTSIPQVSFELLSSTGSRAIDISATIKRYEIAIARTVMADFLMLGSTDSGSRALASPKMDMFNNSLMGILESIASVINRFLVSRLWKLNNFDAQYIPYIKPGRVSSVDLDRLGKYISDLSSAGMPLFPDDSLESELRGAADLPEKNMEDIYVDDVSLVNGEKTNPNNDEV
ncbi:MAG: hypothetical protein GY804_04060 [Alphaproteobacteria bacterium]|nr:hypothetical protein [Alphaproteobacteria bacterium]